ncbi:sensor histidine kinase [Spirillospora sp. NPDC127200]
MPVTAEGPAGRELRAFCRRQAVRTRTVGVVAAGLLALGTTPARHAGTAAAVCAVIVWTVGYHRVLLREGPRARRPLPADAAVLAVLCLAQPWITQPADLAMGAGWVRTVASVTVVSYQWYTRPLCGALVAVVPSLAYLGGALLAGPQAAAMMAPKAAWLLVEAALARALFWLILREGRRADALLAAAERARAARAVTAARRAEEAEYLAALHDTAAATLLMVGLGTAAGRRAWLADQAARDLEVVSGRPGAPVREVDFPGMLAEAARRGAVAVEVAAEPGLRLPPAPAVAMCRCVQEALTNVARHAGVDRALVRAERVGDGVAVEIVDHGRGFVPGAAPGAAGGPDGTRFGRGLALSVFERMVRVGGRAWVDSAPGAGTRVRLEWAPAGQGGEDPAAPAAPEAGRDGFASLTSRRLLRCLRLTALAAVAALLLAAELPTLLLRMGEYRWPAVHWAAFAASAAAVAVCAVLVARGGSLDRWRWPVLAVTAAAGLAVAAAVPPAHLGTWAQWAQGNAGWFAVVLLTGRRLALLPLFWAAEAGLTLALLDGAPGTASPAAALTACLVSWVNQAGVALASVALHRVAGSVAARAAEEERARTQEAVQEQLHRDRRDRYAALAGTAVPLLTGLASGALDPGDPGVRRACSVEAARMRRLMAERDTVADPLLHELQACIDVAERHGVAVCLATRGDRPALPPSVRRALTEPALAVLATAASTARVSVVGSVAGPAAELTVCVVADAPARREHREGGEVTVTTRTIEDRVWMEARWRSPPC